jgi:hypothetical protein
VQHSHPHRYWSQCAACPASSLKAELYAGMAGNGITGDIADAIYAKIEAFANFGFAESHSISSALLVYAHLIPSALPRHSAARPADGLLLPRRPWSPTPAGTASTYADPTCNVQHGRRDDRDPAPTARPPAPRDLA